MAHRLGWGLGDQAISSLTNFAVGLIVARELGATGFGVFGLAWVTFSVALNMSRGLATDPLTVRFSGCAEPEWRQAVRLAVGTAIAVGLGIGLFVVCIGLLVGGRVGGAFVALGAVLPLLLMQDSWRFAFFAAGDGRRAFLNDCVWAVWLIPAMLIAVEIHTVPGFLAAWGLAAGVAALTGLAQCRVRPTVRGMPSWLREHRELGWRYLIENVSLSGSAQLRVYGLGAISGLAAVGVLRGAEQLLGPFVMLLFGLGLVTVAEGARVVRERPRRLMRFCFAVGAVQSAAALAWGTSLLLIPDRLGEEILGSLWNRSSPLILPVTVVVVAASWNTAASAGLRALGAARQSLRCQLIASAATSSVGLFGATLDGARGMAWGVAGAASCSCAVWWVQLNRSLKNYLNTHERVHNGEERPAGTEQSSSTAGG